MSTARVWILAALVCAGWLALAGRLDMQREAFERMQSRASTLCLPAPGEIAHTSLEPSGSVRCAITSRRGGLITRLEVQP